MKFRFQASFTQSIHNWWIFEWLSSSILPRIQIRNYKIWFGSIWGSDRFGSWSTRYRMWRNQGSIDTILLTVSPVRVDLGYGWRIPGKENPPRLERTDAWGKRVDRIWTTPAWKGQHKVSFILLLRICFRCYVILFTLYISEKMYSFYTL